MHIITDPPDPATPPRLVSLLIVKVPDLGTSVAELVGGTLRLDATAPADEQLDAILDAVTHLWTGRAEWGRKPRRLAVAPAVSA